MFGISEFAGEPEVTELRCVLKRLYSDFVVVEIPEKGRVLRPRKDEEEESEGEEEAEEDEEGKRPDKLEEQELERMRKVAEGAEEQCVLDLKDWSKEERKCLHQFIRVQFGHSQIRTNCENGQLTIRQKTNKDANRDSRRNDWPKGRGDFLHFTMTKMNMDTQAAIHLIARLAKLKPSTFAISGTKDRRAITVQRVSAFRVAQRRMEGVARQLRAIWLSDFRYAPTPLKLGDAFGNRFSIVLRDLDPSIDESALGKRVDQWARTGFLNYFGSQRFGSCGVDTAQIGHLMLSGQWEAATRALLAPRPEAGDSLNKCLSHFASTKNASETLRMLESSNASAGASIERTLLTALARSPNGHKAAVLALHRDMRTMYIHAYQSLVFNKIVTKRKQKFGLSVLAGDLDAEGNELDPNSSSIHQVCLPLPSLPDTRMPSNEVGRWCEEIAAEDGVQPEQFSKLERQFGLGSVYRPFLVRPANVHWELLRYSSDSQELQKCEFVPMDTRKEREKGRAEEGKEGSRRALKVQFDLPAGTYATVALRELMRTDFSKQAQKALEAELEEGRKREDEKKTEEEEEKDEKIRKEEEEKEEDGKRTEAEGKKRKTIAEVEMEGKRMKTDEEEKDEVKGEKSEADEKGN